MADVLDEIQSFRQAAAQNPPPVAAPDAIGPSVPGDGGSIAVVGPATIARWQSSPPVPPSAGLTGYAAQDAAQDYRDYLNWRGGQNAPYQQQAAYSVAVPGHSQTTNPLLPASGNVGPAAAPSTVAAGDPLDDIRQARAAVAAQPGGDKKTDNAPKQADGTPKKTGYAANIAAGANAAGAGFLGSPVDLATGALNLVPRAINAAAGTNIPTIQNPVGGSEWFKHAMGLIGANPDDVTPGSVGEQFVRAGVQGAVSAALPLGAAGKLAQVVTNPVARGALETMAAPSAASTATAGAGAGIGGQAASDLAPDQYKPLADTLGQIAGGGVVAGGEAALTAGARAGGSLIRNATAPLNRGARITVGYDAAGNPIQGTAGQIDIAANRLTNAAGTTRDDLSRQIENAPDSAVPGAQNTLGQTLSDPDLLAYERKLRTQNPQPFNNQEAANNTARLTSARGLFDPNAHADAAGNYVLDKLRQINDAGDQAVVSAQEAAGSHPVATVPNVQASDAGQVIREAVAGQHQPRVNSALAAENVGREASDRAFSALPNPNIAGDETSARQQLGMRGRQAVNDVLTRDKAAIKRLYDAIDPDGKLALATGPARQTGKAMRAEFIEGSGVEPTPTEEKWISALENMKPVVSYKSLQQTRMGIGQAAREARREGNAIAERRLNIMRDGIDQTVAKAVADAAHVEAPHVQAGHLGPDESIIGRIAQHASGEEGADAVTSSRFKQEANAFRGSFDSETRSKTGSDAGGRFGRSAVDAARNGAPAVSGIDGAEVSKDGRFSGASGNQSSHQGQEQLKPGRYGAYEKVPIEPERLSSFLIRNGNGLIDSGGDIRSTLGGAKYRPGLINKKGARLDDAALRAWEAGYFPEHSGGRPAINDLLEALDDDLNRNPRYSAKEQSRIDAYHYANEINSEIDRLANEHGLDPRSMTRQQFYDAVSKRMLHDDVGNEHFRENDDFEHRLESHAVDSGYDFNDEFYRNRQPATLEDLEREFRSEEGAREHDQGSGGGNSSQTAGGYTSGGSADRDQGRDSTGTSFSDAAASETKSNVIGLPRSARQGGLFSEQLTPNFDAEAAARDTAARTAKREQVEKFAGAPSAVTKRANDTKFALPDSNVMAQFWKKNGGSGAAEAAQSLARVIGSEKAEQLLGDYAAFDLRSQRGLTNPDGTVKAAKLRDFIDNHSEAFAAYPGLKQRFGNAARAQAELEKLQSARTAVEESNPIKLGATNADVTAQYVKRGPQGREAMESLIRDTGGDQQATQAAHDYLAASLRQAALKNTGWSEPAYQAWMKAHEPALSAAPSSVRDQFESFADAQRAVESAQQARADQIKEYKNSAARHYIGRGDQNVDPQTAITRLVGSENPGADATDLMRLMAGDKAATDGFQRNVAEWFLNKVRSTAQSGTTGEKEIAKNAFDKTINDPRAGKVLDRVLGPEKANALKEIARSMDQQAQSYQATNIKGSPGTAADLHGIGHGEGNAQVIGIVGAELGSEAIGHAIGIGGLPGVALKATALGTGLIYKMMRAAGMKNVQDLETAAVLNPEIARVILSRPTPEARPAVLKRLAGLLANLSVSGGINRPN